MAQRRALITGITGQDGSYLAELLIQKGYDVHGITRQVSAANLHNLRSLYRNPDDRHPDLNLHQGDLSDGPALKSLMLEIEPDEIYNLGAQSHVAASFEDPLYTLDVTAGGALRLLEAVRILAERQPVRLFQASTSEMFGAADEAPQTEATRFHPRSPYGCAKTYAFHQTVNYRESYSLFACNGILYNHESPRRGEAFVTRKITRAVGRIRAGLQQKLSLGNLQARRDWGYAGEYVEAMWLTLQRDEPDDYIIATNATHSIQEFVEHAFQSVGLNWEDHVEVDPRYFRPVEAKLLQGDYSKAKSLLGWEPRTSFAALVQLMVEADYELACQERDAQPAADEAHASGFENRRPSISALPR